MIVARRARRHGLGGHPGASCKTRFNANEILTSLMLTYVAQLLLSYLVRRSLARSRRLQLPADPPVRRVRDHADPDLPAPACISACSRAVIAVGLGWLLHRPGLCSASSSACSARRRARRAYAGFSGKRSHLVRAAARRRRWRALPASFEVGGADRPAARRRSRRATASPRSSSPSSAACIRSASCLAACCWRSPISAASRRRSRSACPTRSPASSRACCCSSCSPRDLLIRYRVRLGATRGRRPRRRGVRRRSSCFASVALSVISRRDAAAAGRDRRARDREVRRAQSRRRGHDAGRRHRRLRRHARHRQRGCSASSRRLRPARRWRWSSRVLTLTLAGQSGGDRPRAHHLRPRPLRADRRRLSSASRCAAAEARHSRPQPTCRSSARSCSARMRWSISRSRCSLGVSWFLDAAHAGLVLRAVGESPRRRPCHRLSGRRQSAIWRRCLRRRHVRPRRRLSLARLHADVGGEHDGRAAAGSRWRWSSSPPGGLARLLLGAYLFGGDHDPAAPHPGLRHRDSRRSSCRCCPTSPPSSCWW